MIKARNCIYPLCTKNLILEHERSQWERPQEKVKIHKIYKRLDWTTLNKANTRGWVRWQTNSGSCHKPRWSSCNTFIAGITAYILLHITCQKHKAKKLDCQENIPFLYSDTPPLASTVLALNDILSAVLSTEQREKWEREKDACSSESIL